MESRGTLARRHWRSIAEQSPAATHHVSLGQLCHLCKSVIYASYAKGACYAWAGCNDRVSMPIPHTAREIADSLTRRIAAGEFRRGERLPSYAELAKEYGSAQRTVARAIEQLRALGIVVGVPGSGVYVAET
jgi:Bacterial regulatory proteins, gntR family